MCESYYNIIIMMLHSHSITYFFSQSPLYFGHTGQHWPSGIVGRGHFTAAHCTDCERYHVQKLHKHTYTGLLHHHTQLEGSVSKNTVSKHLHYNNKYVYCELTAHFGGRVGGHTGQHSPSGIVAPGQSTARQSTNCKDMKGFSDIHYQQSRISSASSMNVQSMYKVHK